MFLNPNVGLNSVIRTKPTIQGIVKDNKEFLNELKGDFSSFKDDFNDLKGDIQGLRDNFKDLDWLNNKIILKCN